MIKKSVVDEGGGKDVVINVGVGRVIGRSWFSLRLSWKASRLHVRGMCAGRG